MKVPMMAVAFVLATAALGSADDAPVNVRGTITAVSGEAVTIENAAGRQTLTVRATTRISYVVKASLADVATGGYIGVTAVPLPDGTWKALEIHLLPPGTGIGSRAYDLAPQSTMTNGTITKADQVKVDTRDGQVLTVDYQTGTKRIVVGPSTPVVTSAPADRSALVPGAHVFASALRSENGTVAQRVSVGKDGLVPPM